MPTLEERRLRALAEYHLLDTPQTEDFDRLANLAARLFDVPIALISLVDRNRQFFKARVGIDICETSREVSFCSHAIAHDDILFIPDALEDDRFSANPLVLGAPFIRFYAGKPLITPAGERLGTVCLIDTKPRSTFSKWERENLTDLAGLVMDRMEMYRLEHVRATSPTRFEKIAATSPDAIICADTNGRVTFWNPSAEKVFGYSKTEMSTKSLDIVIPDSWKHTYEAELIRLQHGEAMELAGRTVELSGLRKGNLEFPAEISFSTWDEDGLASIGAIVRDVTERQLHEERLFRLASLDALTDLPNRNAWRECLTEALASNRPVTVLLLDLDGFKEVNDTFGHSAGDFVLKEVAARLKARCAQALMLARLGGDEFVALLPGNDERAARHAALLLVEDISIPYEFAGQVIDVGVSVGASLAPTHGSKSEDVLGAADLALYRAKASGRGRYEIFSPAFREVAIARRSFERELRLAFENEEFELFYQPQVETSSRRLVGAEALIRWRHPVRGLLTPTSFIEVLSEKPSADAVGEWILRTACQTAAQWLQWCPKFRVGVNLFEAQLRTGRLVSVVRNVLAETRLPPSSLELEIVESILLRNDAGTLKLLNDLREMGVGLAFDDYGTGFASLSLLKRYPVSRLKIDQTFVRDMTHNHEDAAVVKAIIYLSESFGVEVIAEGVETEDQLTFLQKNRCPVAQGYILGKPVDASDFYQLFLRQQPLY